MARGWLLVFSASLHSCGGGLLSLYCWARARCSHCSGRTIDSPYASPSLTILKGVDVLLQMISVLGALAILGAYAANLFGWLGAANLSYSLANLVGSSILTFIAIVDQQIGFILLEGVWALISLWGVIQVLQRIAVMLASLALLY
jgi:hypothetical protein